MKSLTSHQELISVLPDSPRAMLLLYKQGSELSECALSNFLKVDNDGNRLELLVADVTRVRDIHEKYGITSAPALLIFEKDRFVNVIKGCQDRNYYQALADEATYQAKVRESGQSQKSVRVYSTPTCSWCNTLKAYLRKQGIAYTDIDVSRDEHAVQELVHRSGQTGVPQTEIDGRIIVGFDKAKINSALGIRG